MAATMVASQLKWFRRSIISLGHVQTTIGQKSAANSGGAQMSCTATKVVQLIALIVAMSMLSGCGPDSDPAVPEGAISALLGVPVTEEEARAADEERHALVEEAIESCMQGRGFEYTQRPYELSSIRQVDPNEQGFGLAVRMLTSFTGERHEVDPNRAIVAALGSEERAAWFEALEGSPEAGSLEDAAAQLFEGGQSCRQEATDQVKYAFGGASDQVLIDKYYEAVSRVRQDPRVTEATAKWAPCMLRQGYEFVDTNAAMQYVSDRLSAFSQGLGELNRDSSGRPELSQSQMNDLQELADEELIIAQTSERCKEAEVLALREVMAEVEAEFLQEYG